MPKVPFKFGRSVSYRGTWRDARTIASDVVNSAGPGAASGSAAAKRTGLLDTISNMVNSGASKIGVHSDMDMRKTVSGRRGYIKKNASLLGDSLKSMGSMAFGGAAKGSDYAAVGGIMASSAFSMGRHTAGAAGDVGKEAWRWMNSGGFGSKAAKYGAVVGGYAGVNYAGRAMTGGDATHNNTGERDIMGIPFI